MTAKGLYVILVAVEADQVRSKGKKKRKKQTEEQDDGTDFDDVIAGDEPITQSQAKNMESAAADDDEDADDE